MQVIEFNLDIIGELLLLLTQFTQARHRILKQNIHCVDTQDYLPKDLRADEFSEILNDAITEYILNQRLILRDADTISFGPNATAIFTPVPDPEAKILLHGTKAAYLQFQSKKIRENALNEKIAMKLLGVKRDMNARTDGSLVSRDMV
ncbi:MAG: hypothetical protein K9N55_06080 [Phycisphaerae bacterium]|nr:hypothetical protein [Phycisphaerae bacterium]